MVQCPPFMSPWTPTLHLSAPSFSVPISPDHHHIYNHHPPSLSPAPVPTLEPDLAYWGSPRWAQTIFRFGLGPAGGNSNLFDTINRTLSTHPAPAPQYNSPSPSSLAPASNLLFQQLHFIPSFVRTFDSICQPLVLCANSQASHSLRLPFFVDFQTPTGWTLP